MFSFFVFFLASLNFILIFSFELIGIIEYGKSNKEDKIYDLPTLLFPIMPIFRHFIFVLKRFKPNSENFISHPSFILLIELKLRLISYKLFSNELGIITFFNCFISDSSELFFSFIFSISTILFSSSFIFEPLF